MTAALRRRQANRPCAVRPRIALAAALLAAAACGSGAPPPVASPSPSHPSGWVRYQSAKAGYELYHPAEWKETAGSDDEDRHFSPGPDPLTGPVWLTVRTATRQELTDMGFEGCSDYNLNPERYKRAGSYRIGGKEAARYVFETPPGFPSEPSYEEIFVAEAGERCYRFGFVSPAKAQWNRHSGTALRILDTVAFRA